MNAVLGLVARFGAIVLLLATAAACGFIIGRTTTPAPPPSACSEPLSRLVLGTRVVYLPNC